MPTLINRVMTAAPRLAGGVLAVLGDSGAGAAWSDRQYVTSTPGIDRD